MSYHCEIRSRRRNPSTISSPLTDLGLRTVDGQDGAGGVPRARRGQKCHGVCNLLGLGGTREWQLTHGFLPARFVAETAFGRDPASFFRSVQWPRQWRTRLECAAATCHGQHQLPASSRAIRRPKSWPQLKAAAAEPAVEFKDVSKGSVRTDGDAREGLRAVRVNRRRRAAKVPASQKWDGPLLRTPIGLPDTDGHVLRT